MMKNKITIKDIGEEAISFLDSNSKIKMRDGFLFYLPRLLELNIPKNVRHILESLADEYINKGIKNIIVIKE